MVPPKGQENVKRASAMFVGLFLVRIKMYKYFYYESDFKQKTATKVRDKTLLTLNVNLLQRGVQT